MTTEISPDDTHGFTPDSAGPTSASIVLCDPDRDHASDLVAAARGIGARTHWCTDGASALIAVGAEHPTVLVIAGRVDGAVTTAQVIESVRKHSELLILVGADPSDQEASTMAMAAGGSALIARPYDLVAIAAVAQLRPPTAVRQAGPISVNPVTYEVYVDDREVLLTARELDLLVFLIEQRGRVASADQISQHVWGHSTDTNTVAVHIKRLRDKLGTDSDHGQLIRTIRGVGYRLAPSACE